MSEHDMGIKNKSSSLPEETQHRLATYADASDLYEIVTSELPVVDLVQLTTQEDVRTVSESPQLYSPVVDDISLASQPLLPTMIPRSDEVGDTAPENGNIGSETLSYLSIAIDIIKNSGIYALGAFASPLISLVLTPFLTQHLSKNDYGGLIVLYTVIDIVTVITQLGLIPAFFRVYNGDYESPRDRLGVLSASISILLLVSIPIAVVLMIIAPWLSEFLFNSPSFIVAVRFAVLVMVLENLTVPGISWLRAEKRTILYSTLSIANLLLVLGTTVVSVGVLNMGVNGALLAKGVGYASIVICTLPIILLLAGRRQCLHLRFDIVRNLLLFGIPTIFSDTATWVLQLSDRYLLSHFGSLAQTAIYSVAYMLGGVLSTLILGPFLMAWPPIMYTIAKRSEAKLIFQQIFHWLSIILLFAAFALSLLSTVILDILFPPSYQSASAIIPIIALSMTLYGIYYMFIIGINVSRKTIFTILFTTIAAVVNIFVNILLIPRFGAIGSAISTLLAYIVLVVVAYIVNQRIYPMKFKIGLFMIEICGGIALYVGSRLLAHDQKPLISWSISIGALMLYGVFLMLLGGLSIKSLKKTFWYVRETFSKVRNKSYA